LFDHRLASAAAKLSRRTCARFRQFDRFLSRAEQAPQQRSLLERPSLWICGQCKSLAHKPTAQQQPTDNLNNLELKDKPGPPSQAALKATRHGYYDLFRRLYAGPDSRSQLFALFNQHLEAKGYIARGGQIVDATIVSAPRQHNSRSENAAIKAGKTPAGWQEKPAKNAQKDKDARWTKKHDQSFYGYKNHIGIDRTHKLIRRYTETDASVHDSQMLDDVLDKSNTGAEVWADSAYRSAESEAKLEAKGYKSRVHRRARRNHPLSAREQAGNTTRSRVRARVEHVFGHQHTSMGGTIVRTIGIVRARTKIGLMNLVYNISRLVQLERVVAAPA
jgi:IS5 family transposase